MMVVVVGTSWSKWGKTVSRPEDSSTMQVCQKSWTGRGQSIEGVKGGGRGECTLADSESEEVDGQLMQRPREMAGDALRGGR